MQVPSDDGLDDAYGFFDMHIKKDNITITAYSHGGKTGKLIIRSQTVIPANKKRIAPKATETMV